MVVENCCGPLYYYYCFFKYCKIVDTDGQGVPFINFDFAVEYLSLPYKQHAYIQWVFRRFNGGYIFTDTGQLFNQT